MFFVTSLHLGLYLYLVFFLLQSLRHGIRRATSLYTSEAWLHKLLLYIVLSYKYAVMGDVHADYSFVFYVIFDFQKK